MSHHVQLNLPESHRAKKEKSFANMAVWACGFRPFFLGGAALAALSVVYYMVIFFGGFQTLGTLGAVGWHIHEMIFGFAPAIIAGFLLTAVPKWTRIPLPTGTALAAVFGLWLAGRLAMAMAGVIPYLAVAMVEFLFLPVLALAISIPIIKARTPRNLGFVPLLFGLATANALFHLNQLGILSGVGGLATDAGLGIIIVIIAIVGGRVIPFFTVNRLGHARLKRGRKVDIMAMILTVAWLVTMLVFPTSWATAAIAILAGLANLIRMKSWGSFRTAKVPLLWVLHVGYAFVGVGLILYGLAILDVAGTRSAAVHALTTGAIGILCLGMMARVSLGHAGRELKAHKITAFAFGLITLAALLRVFIPLLIPAVYTGAVIASSVAWTGAWVLFLVIYAPILVQPRIDGRPG